MLLGVWGAPPVLRVGSAIKLVLLDFPGLGVDTCCSAHLYFNAWCQVWPLIGVVCRLFESASLLWPFDSEQLFRRLSAELEFRVGEKTWTSSLNRTERRLLGRSRWSKVSKASLKQTQKNTQWNPDVMLLNRPTRESVTGGKALYAGKDFRV